MRLTKPLAAILALAFVGSAGVAVAASVASGGEDGETARTTRRGPTAKVTRRDLVERESFEGKLAYDDVRTLVSSASGTVTRLPEEGTVVRRGQVLYVVDGRPVRLFYGSTPAWRSLREGVEDGADVRQLEENLVAMGYDPEGDIEVDQEFDWATEAAIRRWQDDMGLEEDGVIDLGEIVFLPGPRRIEAHKTQVGALVTPGSEILETSAKRKVATFDLDVDQQDLVREGDRVEVELPDGTTLRGKVSQMRITSDSGGSEEDEATGSESEDPTIQVTVSLPPQAAARALSQTPVDVNVVARIKRDVLAVPVTALLALAEGGYAVEVRERGRTRLVAVTPGMYADGWVQISGSGISEGTPVVIPE